MRGIDRPGRRDHLPRCEGGLFFSFENIIDAGGAGALKDDTPRLGACANSEIVTPARRIEIGKRRAPSEAAVDSHVHPGDTFLLKAVHVIGKGIACLLSRFHPGVIEWIVAWSNRNMKRAVAATIVIGSTIVCFRLFEIGQAIGIGPVFKPRLRRPAVIVERMAAHIAHAVDSRGPAKGLAPRPVYLPVVEVLLRFGVILPGKAGRMHGIAQGRGHTHAPVPPRRPFSGFEQQDGHLRHLAQAVRQHGPRRSRADNHIVIGLFSRHPSVRVQSVN